MSKHLNAESGDFISLDEMQLLCKNHDEDNARSHAQQKSMKQPVRAIYFGKEKVMQLLSHPDCIGLRIYYGLKIDTDGDGIKEKKMVLVAVDEHGNDILPAATPAGAGNNVAKSMSRAAILDGGVPCPEFCTDPTKPNK
ncbi:hypothetical protein [Chitinophaga nivalis]|uniref:Uncharacterized protein n=1 Tax=Chitinophaga nivalis TaxID=2991709 RepID=A0ABT3IL76_9BACT|nr:hypothetical protein [Chitinophaga nivalis]MCW3465599.1 hypothetical protein [Chitinophaga nivalis]MCW3484710.1 hypothetical protein [Chitinophaga nivalis]